jgi:hypothetical protein
MATATILWDTVYFELAVGAFANTVASSTTAYSSMWRPFVGTTKQRVQWVELEKLRYRWAGEASFKWRRRGTN